MNNLTLVDPSNLSEFSNAELRERLARALTVTAEGLYHAAAIWAELNRRGERLQELRSGLADWLPRIARRELAAEAVIAFAGQRFLLRHMVGMPLDAQRRLASGSPVPVATINERGEVIGEDKPLADLTAKEVVLAFGEGGSLRPISAQIKSLSLAVRRVKKTAASPGRGASTAQIWADEAYGVIVVGRMRVEPRDLASALHRLGWRLTRVADASGAQEGSIAPSDNAAADLKGKRQRREDPKGAADKTRRSPR